MLMVANMLVVEKTQDATLLILAINIHNENRLIGADAKSREVESGKIKTHMLQGKIAATNLVEVGAMIVNLVLTCSC